MTWAVYWCKCKNISWDFDDVVSFYARFEEGRGEDFPKKVGTDIYSMLMHLVAYFVNM